MFEPKGHEAQWETIYHHIAAMNVGDTLTYDTLAGLLPYAAESSVRPALYRAVQQLEEDNSRTLANVRGVGYRMVRAAEHEGLARDQHRKAKRRLKAATRKVRSADRSQLTPEERRRFDAMADHLSRQQSMIRRLDDRVARTERDLRAVRRDQKQNAAELSERVDALAKLLERHGIGSEVDAA